MRHEHNLQGLTNMLWISIKDCSEISIPRCVSSYYTRRYFTFQGHAKSKRQRHLINCKIEVERLRCLEYYMQDFKPLH